MSAASTIGPTPNRSTNGVGSLSRFNAWFFDNVTGYANHIASEHKRSAFGDIDRGTILEVGAGAGANFAFLPPGSTVIALEPSVAMHGRLMRRARRHQIDLQLLAEPAESISLPDNSVDTVICSLVLCTVDDPAAVLSEVRRVLRPGGTLRFVEHVEAAPTSPRRAIQRLLRRPWAWLFEGCDLCRDTVAQIDAAGYESVEYERRRFRRSIFVPVNSAVYGIARVPS